MEKNRWIMQIANKSAQLRCLRKLQRLIYQRLTYKCGEFMKFRPKCNKLMRCYRVKLPPFAPTRYEMPLYMRVLHLQFASYDDPKTSPTIRTIVHRPPILSRYKRQRMRHMLTAPKNSSGVSLTPSCCARGKYRT